MRLGVLLPTFRRSPQVALEAAHDAATAGLDGVFAYDHVWPMGSPERPALAPFEVLGAVAAREPGLVVGPLVARIGLVEGHVLAAQLRALRLAAGAGVVAALGTGDRKSVGENVAYGVPLAPATERRAALAALGRELLEEGMEVWIGDGAAATRAVAVELRCTLNLWQRPPKEVAAEAGRTEVSWAGPWPRRDDAPDEPALRALLSELAAAGATWAVLSPGIDPALVARCRPTDRGEAGSA